MINIGDGEQLIFVRGGENPTWKQSVYVEAAQMSWYTTKIPSQRLLFENNPRWELKQCKALEIWPLEKVGGKELN